MENGRAPQPDDCKWEPRERGPDGSMLARPAGSITNHQSLQVPMQIPETPGAVQPPEDSAPVAPNPTFRYSGRATATAGHRNTKLNTIDPDHHDMRESSPGLATNMDITTANHTVAPHGDCISNAP